MAWGDLIGSLGFAVLSLAGDIAWAQEAADPGRGRVIARQICSECHAVESKQTASPRPAAPTFERISNVPGMTALALSAVMQSSHPTMPNIMLKDDELRDIIAYLLSLRRAK